VKEKSERLPGKNFKVFNGRPLYHWILDTLEAVPEIEKIVVNTDAKRIIEGIPDHFNVEVSIRPENLRDDKVTTDIIKYEVNRIDSDIFLHTYCTCPLLTPKTISSAISKFLESPSYDSLLPVTKHQKRFYDSEFEPINHDPVSLSPSQNIPPVYEDNSVLFIYTEESLKKTGHRIGNEPLPFEIDKREAIEIDYLSDFKIAEIIHSQRP
jgi:CMP-N-acetylneuraminic acid synthetase